MVQWRLWRLQRGWDEVAAAAVVAGAFLRCCQPCDTPGHTHANPVSGQLCCWPEDLNFPLKCHDR